LVVVPHKDQAALRHGGPGTGLGAEGDALGVRDALALAVAAPAPVVEGAGDVAVLDLAVGQVAAEVPAVAVEDVDLALGAGPPDQPGAEGVARVRVAVGGVLDGADAW